MAEFMARSTVTFPLQVTLHEPMRSGHVKLASLLPFVPENTSKASPDSIIRVLKRQLQSMLGFKCTRASSITLAGIELLT